MTDQKFDAARKEAETVSIKANPSAQSKPVEQFLGDKPGSIVVRLVFISLIVGAMMAVFETSPIVLVENVFRFFRSVFGEGFDAVQKVASWVIMGAVIVVPIWLISRLLRQRNA